MPVAAGSVLGQYEVIALLGEGGMGRVYRARDQKLKRDVAIKILPEEFAHDGARLSRFRREAEALAALSHPNIAAIYDLQEHAGETFLVLELVEGDTLAELLAKRGPLGIDEALHKAREICGALEAAHERGIVHRDLKPPNVKITPGGSVKLLDFGLARMREDGNVAAETAVRSGVTSAGSVMGTPAYMSPEQARGEVVDVRTDVWAFGCVLFEMLTGASPFEAATTADTIGRIVIADPDWTRLPPPTPTGVRALLRQCLQKDRNRRLAHLSDARVWIDDVLANPTRPGEAAPPGRRAGRFAWAGWAAAALATVALAAVAFRHATEPAAPELRLQMVTPPQSDATALALSPDGRRIVFPVALEGRTQLWLRALDELTATPMAGTDGASFPFWSPDGRSVGFFADGQLKRIDIGGGVPVSLLKAPLGRGASWNKNDVIVFAPSGTGALHRVAATGGEVVAVTELETGHMSHRFPQFLPDGDHFIFFATGSSPGLYAGSLSGEAQKRILNSEAASIVTAAGFLFFVREGALFAQPFDLHARELHGQPVPVAEQVAIDTGAFLAGFSAASNVVAYRTGGAGGRRQLIWFDRSGKVLETVGAADNAFLTGAEMSPDGRRVAVNRMVNGNLDVWLIDVVKGAMSRNTMAPSLDAWPHWSADGSRIVFSSNAKGTYDLYDRSTRGDGADRLVFASDQAKIPQDTSSDGQLIFASLDSQSGFDLWTVPLAGGAAKVLLKTPYQESGAQWSPDGKWVAYHSNESGRYEVYVQAANGQEGRTQVSLAGGGQPRWRRDGGEMFYVSLDNRIMAAPITGAGGSAPEFGGAVPLFAVEITGGPIVLNNTQHYAVSADGNRFLVNVSIDPTPPINLLYNWNPGSSK